jgi:hypothetical protein
MLAMLNHYCHNGLHTLDLLKWHRSKRRIITPTEVCTTYIHTSELDTPIVAATHRWVPRYNNQIYTEYGPYGEV